METKLKVKEGANYRLLYQKLYDDGTFGRNFTSPIFFKREIDLVIGSKILRENDDTFYIFNGWKWNESDSTYEIYVCDIRDYLKSEINEIIDDENLDLMEVDEMVGDVLKDFGKFRKRCLVAVFGGGYR